MHTAIVQRFTDRSVPTPTVAEGSVFAFGATGKLTRLNTSTGEKIWEVKTPEVTEAKPPPTFWGYASSPYVAKGLVVVFVNGVLVHGGAFVEQGGGEARARRENQVFKSQIEIERLNAERQFTTESTEDTEGRRCSRQKAESEGGRRSRKMSTEF